MKPYFSIIIPVYNVEKQLEYCIESVLNQTFNDYEVLLVDDGSKDASGEMCEDYAKNYEYIKCFHKQNGGLSDARNYGIERANGKYYLFIDSDDVLDKDFCKVLHKAHETHSADIVSTDIIPFYTYDELEELKQRKREYKERIFCSSEIIREYYCPSEKTSIYHGLCMKSYKADLFDDLRFEKGRLHEDLFITYKLLDRCNKFVYIDLPYYYYYQNIKSITHNYSVKNYEDEMSAIELMIQFFENRVDVKKELVYFILNHFFYLMERCCKLPNVSKNMKRGRAVADWLATNIWICDRKSFTKKVINYIGIKCPSVYFRIKQIME